jgi:hypothetical protein
VFGETLLFRIGFPGRGGFRHAESIGTQPRVVNCEAFPRSAWRAQNKLATLPS